MSFNHRQGPSRFLRNEDNKAVFTGNLRLDKHGVQIALSNLRRQDPKRYPIVTQEIPEFEAALASFNRNTPYMRANKP